jgi:uncharacterized membrane protein
MALTSRAGRALRDRVRDAPPEWWALAAMVTVWAAVFGRLVVLRHERFGSQSFDLGIFDQATWLASRGGDLFITVRGLELLGHHANLGLFLLAPFYRLGAGPHFINLLQVASMALGAVPVFLLAREHFGGPRLALVPAGAYLLHPALGFFAWEEFHPDVMAITPLLFAWWFARRERWGAFAACMVYAVSWKEDVALAAVVLGVVLLLRGHRRAGLVTAATAAGWFLFVNRVLLPGVSGEAFYDHLFSDLGDSPWEIVTTLTFHPTRILRALGAPDARTYVWQMLGPFGFLPLLAPLAFGVGAPQFVLNVVSEAGFTRSISYHFSSLPLAGMTLGMVEAIAFLGRRTGIRRVLVGALAATSLAGAILWGVSPIGHEYDEGWWPLAPNARQVAMEQAVGLPPGDAAVSATYEFVPHLAHRRQIYDWPNPWVATNWGLHNEGTPDPGVVEWLVVDRRLVGENADLLDRLLGDGEFRLVFDSQDIVVARRVGSDPSGAPR